MATLTSASQIKEGNDVKEMYRLYCCAGGSLFIIARWFLHCIICIFIKVTMFK